MKRNFLALVTAAALGLAAGPAALAQDAGTAPDNLTETYGAWTLKCGAEKKSCHVLQTLYRAEDKARLLQVALFTPPDKDGQLFFRSLTPLGSVIPEATVLIVDQAPPKAVPFFACWPRGCLAETAVSRSLERALREGNKLAVQVKSADNGKTIRFELSLDGISKALDRLRALDQAG